MVDKAKQNKNYRGDWGTPFEVQGLINQGFDYKIRLDVCANASNTKCVRWFDKETDGLQQSWEPEKPGDLWWCNPDFRLVKQFLEKAYNEYQKGHQGIMLVPSSQETKWFRELITHRNLRRMVWPGRINFIEPNDQPTTGNTCGSVIVAFIKPEVEIRRLFEDEPWIMNLR
jgi:site-specific DNA-methyltransferase (adenine-specific)